jgi:MoaA/NifB/PqqE/SkfB family radical SAM enzyme
MYPIASATKQSRRYVRLPRRFAPRNDQSGITPRLLNYLMTKNTFCTKLWTEVFIDNTGDAFACCHNKPLAFGNIYKENLKEIINNKTARIERQKALDGRLHCFARCSLLNRQHVQPQNRPAVTDYNDLKELHILFAENCNIDCIMCFQKRTNRACLDYKTLINRVDINPFDLIELQGGEPLFIDAAMRYFDYAVSRKKKVSLITTGLLINEEWAEKIALHSLSLTISLNAATRETHETINRGSHWDTVLRHIEMVRAYCEKHHTRVILIGHMTIVRQNIHEIPLFIKHFKQLGFDKIKFGYDKKTVPIYLMLHPFLKIDLRSRIQNEIQECCDPNAINMLRLILLGLL